MTKINLLKKKRIFVYIVKMNLIKSKSIEIKIYNYLYINS